MVGVSTVWHSLILSSRRGCLVVARWLHTIYKTCISPLLGNACRFEPACSDYALEALEKHGIARGLGLALWRVMRCHPYCQGGQDPVPEAPKQISRG